MIKVLEILKAPKFETLICNIDKDGRTDKIKLIYENSSEIVEKFRIYKPLTCFPIEVWNTLIYIEQEVKNNRNNIYIVTVEIKI